jgi:hypothetical protein
MASAPTRRPATNSQESTPACRAVASTPGNGGGSNILLPARWLEGDRCWAEAQTYAASPRTSIASIPSVHTVRRCVVIARASYPSMPATQAAPRSPMTKAAVE